MPFNWWVRYGLYKQQAKYGEKCTSGFPEPLLLKESSCMPVGVPLPFLPSRLSLLLPFCGSLTSQNSLMKGLVTWTPPPCHVFFLPPPPPSPLRSLCNFHSPCLVFLGAVPAVTARTLPLDAAGLTGRRGGPQNTEKDMTGRWGRGGWREGECNRNRDSEGDEKASRQTRGKLDRNQEEKRGRLGLGIQNVREKKETGELR